MIWAVGFLLLLAFCFWFYLSSQSASPVSWLFVCQCCCLVLLAVFCVLVGHALA